MTHPGFPGPKPRWLRVPLGGGARYREVRSALGALELHTVCEEAGCPNAGECWSAGTATFLLMGRACTRSCRFCDVAHRAAPPPLDPGEPARVASAVERLGLAHAVLTSVDRDDLPDGGAAHFAEAIRRVRTIGRTTVEALTPDFGGDAGALREIGRAAPDVFGQNLETVRRLTPTARDPRAGYDLTLEVLARVKREFPEILTKSSLLLGMGETMEEVREAMRDLRSAGVESLALGQYLQPSPRQLPVAEWVTPGQFAEHEKEGYAMGFRFVASGPLVRSSYRAGEQLARRSLAALALAAAVLAGGCAGRPIPPTQADPRAFAGEAWESQKARAHALVGYALSTKDERWVALDELRAAVAGAEFVILGETHDNPDHHRLQATLLEAALAGGRRPALAFEMFDTSQAEPLAAALSAAAATPDDVAKATQWDKSGWPDFALYRPIFEVGLAAKLGIVAANLPRPVAREVVRKGPGALPGDVREWLERAGEPSREELRTWAEEMKEDHCGELPKELLSGLVRAQRARDAQMALKAAAAGGKGSVLITGDGHARTDRGVPAWLGRIVPGARVVSIGLVEVDEELRWPRQYAEEYGGARLPFDFVVFTPRAEREDPCEGLRRHKPGAPAKGR
ncbi:MAG TPA: lipoyl synthase [Anaeromyxobacteraceae bacterium]|nr:lipoyl synthase [Anaeromyxobacteraceae bacterium]